MAAALAAAAPAHFAHASWFGLDTIAGGVIGYIAYGLIYIIATIAGVAISIITYLISILLQVSSNVVNTAAVQVGFSVMLAIANLGFVLFIIIIAIATILKRESYGMKKSLWRLVIAAILVNFSLVIGGAVINFANIITNQFLQQLPGGGGNNGPTTFAQELAGAFAPQKGLLVLSSSGNNVAGNIAGSNLGDVNAGSTIASMITPVVSVSAAAALLIAIIITLAAFATMLLIRYVYLSILLIVMPFAWLMWVFEGTKGQFKKWWDSFIRWSFFAPIVVFFLWLSIATAQKLNTNNNDNPIGFLAGTSYTANTSNPITGALGSTFGSFVAAFASTSLQAVLVVGLAVGGMIAANKLSIMGAKNAVGAMDGGAKAFRNYVVKRGKRGTLTVAQKTMGGVARVAAPSPGAPPNAWNRFRGSVATRFSGASANLGQAATSSNLKTKGLAATVWGGIKQGSGLFKGASKSSKDWECQVCHNVQRSTIKPTTACQNCHSPAALAKWTQI